MNRLRVESRPIPDRWNAWRFPNIQDQVKSYHVQCLDDEPVSYCLLLLRVSGGSRLASLNYEVVMTAHFSN